MSLTLATVIGVVEVALAVGGIREEIRSEFGIPNENIWAYVAYALIHGDIIHLLENAGSLLICGAIVEVRIGGWWFLVLVVLTTLLGGYLTTLVAPVLIDSPWNSGLPSVGLSIVVYAVVVLCLLFVIDFIWKERLFRLSSYRWKRLAATLMVSLFFCSSFYSGVQGLPGESILGHSIGMAVGVVVFGVFWIVRRIRYECP